MTMYLYSHCMFMYGYPDWGFSVLFPQLLGKCQGKTRKDGAWPALFLIFVLFYAFSCCFMYFLLFYVLFVLCRSLYCFAYMCTELLPPGGYPIGVKYIISYQMTYRWGLLSEKFHSRQSKGRLNIGLYICSWFSLLSDHSLYFIFLPKEGNTN